MATELILVRHGAHDELGQRLSGRSDIGLNAQGRAQAQAVADRLAGEEVSAILASPRRRTRETAEPIAERLGIAAETAPALDEVNFGEWTGRAFTDLADDADWRRWNAARSLARPPGGESMAQVQARMVRLAGDICAALPDGGVVLVGHAEPLRALVLYHLGLGLDAWPRIDIAPGSVTRLAIEEWGARITLLNEVPR